MNAFSLAVLLTIVQAVPPTPPRTSAKTAGRGEAVKKDSTSNQSPTIPAENVTGAKKQQDSNPAPSDTDRRESIQIRELPPVSVSKDWWDRSAVILTGLLVLIGVIGTRFALRTLLSIESQTKALIEGQRPRIAAEPHGNPIRTVEDVAAPRVEMELINRGQTAARGLTYQTWIEVLPDPFQDFTHEADHFGPSDPVVLYPNHVPIVINIPVRQGITPQQRAELRAARMLLCLRIQVSYSDAFSPLRNVSFGFAVKPDGLAYLPTYNHDD